MLKSKRRSELFLEMNKINNKIKNLHGVFTTNVKKKLTDDEVTDERSTLYKQI